LLPSSFGASAKKNLKPTSGDINALFAVLLDNIANMAVISGTLIYGFDFPARIVYVFIQTLHINLDMIPGTAFGVLLGCLGLAFMAIQLDAKNSSRGMDNLITAIPLGLDAPTTIGLPLVVIGPSFVDAKKSGMSVEDAAKHAWYLGCAVVVIIGILKLLLAFFGEQVQKLFHAAGKSGALASIGLALLGFMELTTILMEPVTGLISLWFLFLALLHRFNKEFRPIGLRLPYGISGVMVSAILGAIIFYVTAFGGISVGPLPHGLTQNYYLAGYLRPANFYSLLRIALSRYGAVAIPYAIMVNIGGMTVCSAAKIEGNDFNTTAVQILDALCTILGGVFGGVSQTTPYIGHTAYHRTFKSRSFYTVANGILIGLGGILGYISFLSQVLPKSAILPIFIFVAFEIVSSSFHDERPNHEAAILTFHAPALIFSFFPAIAQVVQIVLSQLYDGKLLESALNPVEVQETLNLSNSIVSVCGVVVLLAHGFIMTSLLWGSALAFVIDQKLMRASSMLALCSIFSLFGIIHSVQPDGGIYLPWNINSVLPYHWAVGYAAISILTYTSKYFLIEQEKQED